MEPLYKIAANYLKFFDDIGEDDFFTDEMRQEALDKLDGSMEDKIYNTSCYIRNIEALADNIDDAIRDMKERKAALEKKAGWYRNYALQHMTTTGCTKFDYAHFKVSVRNNGASLDIQDEHAIDPIYLKREVVTTIDKRAITELLKQDVPVAGCQLKYSKSLVISAGRKK